MFDEMANRIHRYWNRCKRTRLLSDSDTLTVQTIAYIKNNLNIKKYSLRSIVIEAFLFGMVLDELSKGRIKWNMKKIKRWRESNMCGKMCWFLLKRKMTLLTYQYDKMTILLWYGWSITMLAHIFICMEPTYLIWFICMEPTYLRLKTGVQCARFKLSFACK